MMRPIHLAQLDKMRPVLVMTRERARRSLKRVTIIPITGTIRGLTSEVLVGPRNGLDKNSVITCDNIITILKMDLGRQIGFLLAGQELELTKAMHAAFDLEDV